MSGLFGRGTGGGGASRKPVPSSAGGNDPYSPPSGAGNYGRQPAYDNEKLNFRGPPQAGGGLPGGPGPRMRTGSGAAGAGYDRGGYDRGSSGGGGGYDRGPERGGGGYDRGPPARGPAAPRSAGRQQLGMGETWHLKPAKSPSNEFTFGNLYVPPPRG